MRTRHTWLIRWLSLGAILLCILMTGPAVALSPTSGKNIGTFLLKESRYFESAFPASRIEELAQIASKPGGTKLIGEELGRMNLPTEIIEDTFARILVVQGHIQKEEAERWMRRLSGVDGFRAAMRKSMGASEANTIGHVNEIRIADKASQANFNVHGIGVPFKDPYKKGTTDIDILLERRGRLIAIEAKDYPANASIPMDGFRADMLSLAEYRIANPNQAVVAVFAMTNKPSNPDTWKLLQAAANQHKVEILVGSPEELLHQIPLLIK